MPEEYDLFVSYARADNRDGWIEHFLDGLVEEHRRFSGGRSLELFFDRKDVANFAYWEEEIFRKGLTRARLFLAFLSPNYFASEVCRKEWKAWIDQEIALHILTSGSAPIYIVEVPGFVAKPMLPEHEVARKVAERCDLPAPHDRFALDVAPMVKELRRRQLNAVQPFYHAGVAALQQADLRKVLHQLAHDLDRRVEDVRRAAASASTIPPYNRKFSGRLDELLEVRRRLTDNRTGIIASIHGLGGIGKTELAYTYAHAFAGVYPGGRFLVRCEHQTDLRTAVLRLGEEAEFRARIGDEERKTPEAHFLAVCRCLKERLEQLGHVLLVLDNVTAPGLLNDTDALTTLGPRLHLLATTRLPTTGDANWLTLGALQPAEALDLLEKHRPFADETERTAAQRIVRQLGGFTLAVELVAAGLAVKTGAAYASVAAGLGLDDLDMLAEDRDVVLRRHNDERRLQGVLGPTLADLSAEGRRALEYAAFLPADMVPLPWLRELVTANFPALGKAGRWGDPWEDLCGRLVRLGLFAAVEEETTARRLVRVHRLVQELIRRALSEEERQARQQCIERLVEARDAALEETSQWQDARWEFDPLGALAWLWAEAGHPEGGWLMNQVGIRWHHVAEWSRAEPLMRRSLEIDERSFGPEHPNVAKVLNNLAQLLQATNRLGAAEPLMRRALRIDEHSFGPEHPRVATRLNNLAALLQAINRLGEAEPLYFRCLVILSRFQLRTGYLHPDATPFTANYRKCLTLLGHTKAKIEHRLSAVLEEARHSLPPS